MKKVFSVVGILALLLLTNCAEELIPKETGEGLFVDGCPEPGKSIAKAIANPELRMDGPDALGGQGDYLLMNEHAAFIIQGTGHVNTYYYYGGTPIDGVALAGCSQASQERFEEMGFVVGLLDLENLVASTIRCFRGDSVRVINDGSNGQAAVVRVYGTDDFFWLIELELIGIFYTEFEIPKPLSDPLGLDIYVDYILPPDSQALRIEYNVHNTSNDTMEIFAGTILFFGDTTIDQIPLKYHHQTEKTHELLEFLGMETVPVGVPWVVASNGDGAWSFAMKNVNMGTANVSGVTVGIDVDQLLETPLSLAPNDTITLTSFFAVGEGDHNTALQPLYESNPNPVGLTYELADLEGTSYDILTGDPLSNVQVEVQIKNQEDEWVYLTSFISDESGFYGGPIPDLGVECRLIARLEGRPSPPSVYFYPSGTLSIIDSAFMPGGLLLYDVRDYSTGENIPAKILVWENENGGKLIRRIYSTTGYGNVELAPGNYWVTATRGYEYTTHKEEIEINQNSLTLLEVSLEKAVDTTGFLSVDTHMHAGPSPDNSISIPDRIASVAGEGLEVAVSTDHEYVGSWQSAIDDAELGHWLATVMGQEVTAPLPGHSNIYGGIEPRYEIGVRGGPVKWWEPDPFVGYPMDTAQIFAAERARGAQVIQVNHPRATGMTYYINYDPVTGQPLAAPSDLGYPEDGTLWDWDFDAFELMNGTDDVFEKFGEGGTFDDWMSFLNQGHRVTAVGASDVHDYSEWPGYPRNYFVSPTDKPSEFKEEDLVKAMLEGRSVLSTGAFARVAIVDGTGTKLAGMGDTYTLPGEGPLSLWVHIEAIPEIDVTDFMVFVNCDLASGPVSTTSPDSVIKYDGIVSVEVPTDKDAHIVVLGFGENQLPLGLPRPSSAVPRFVTNAIYIDTDNTGAYDNLPGPKECYSQ